MTYTRRRGAAASRALVLALFAGCGQGESVAQRPVAQASATIPQTTERPRPRLPKTKARFWPALVAAPAERSGAALSEPARCAPCHADIVEAWQASAHAFASFNNPIYRVSVGALRAARPLSASLACGGCHDPALLVDNAMSKKIDPEDPRAHAGVSCETCHGIASASADGNGSYHLKRMPIYIPQTDSQNERAKHRATARTDALAQAELCASCHRAFLGVDSGNAHFLAGADDFGPWARSPYAGSHGRQLDSVAQKSCADCHMPQVPSVDPAARGGRVASHFFPGGHTWLQAMRGDAKRLAEAQRFLVGAARLDIAAASVDGEQALLPDLSVPLAPGRTLLLDLVLENLRVGHHFPGGVRDVQDTWLEVRVLSAAGAVLAASGAQHGRREEPGAHRLRAAIVNQSGKEVRGHATHEFRSVAFDHTLGPREARVVRFSFVLPDDISLVDPHLVVKAALHHRSRDRPMQNAACREAKGRRGRAYAAAARKAQQPVLDPCSPQPVTVIATAQAKLGASPSSVESAKASARLYAYGRALLADVQEQLPRAETALRVALEEAGREGNHRIADQSRLALATLYARQGRTAESLTALSKLPDQLHPVVQRVRGEALAQVWRFDQALTPLGLAAHASPRDDELWARYAMALGSVGKHEQALAAARSGLISAPRSEPLLRVQALSLAGLKAPSADGAWRAYLDHRKSDGAPAEGRRCEQSSINCARERRPIHIHPLR